MAPRSDTSEPVALPDDAFSLDCFEEALASLFRADGRALATIERAFERDPEFAAGHCLRAGALVLGGADNATGALAASVAAIERSPHPSACERRHAAAARCWLGGNVARAARLYGELLRDNPRDRVALIVAHGLDFRLGQRDMLRDRIKAVLPHWSASDREYGYVLGMYAFGLEETDDYDRASAFAHRSLELVPDNAAAIHVVAHVLEMRGPPEKGIAWLLETKPIWIANAGFRIHLAWHLALFQLDADAVADALATYDTLIAPHLDGSNNGLVDASALLWRLELRGTESRRRWHEVTRLWQRQRAFGSRAFDVIHAVIAFAAAKKHAFARRLANRVKRDPLLRGRSAPEELALAERMNAAVMSFCRGDYGRAVESIAAIRAGADRCGGSVAQCDLIHLTLLEAALRDRRNRLAQMLATERAARKPLSRLNRWLKARAWMLGRGEAAT
ncbi:MAG TPA: tetratricopeptide repeat protein [Casimicrobiaceae bacterium]|nr:tetratricopeptide repeat protein [Casimicrobiaceae bacterium]